MSLKGAEWQCYRACTGVKVGTFFVDTHGWESTHRKPYVSRRQQSSRTPSWISMWVTRSFVRVFLRFFASFHFSVQRFWWFYGDTFTKSIKANGIIQKKQTNIATGWWLISVERCSLTLRRGVVILTKPAAKTGWQKKQQQCVCLFVCLCDPQRVFEGTRVTVALKVTPS